MRGWLKITNEYNFGGLTEGAINLSLRGRVAGSVSSPTKKEDGIPLPIKIGSLLPCILRQQY